MAVLTTPQRAAAFAEFIEGLRDAKGETIATLKADVLAAVHALDDWLDSNAAAINAAIPQPARGTLTTKQKARILAAVIRQRYIVANGG